MSLSTLESELSKLKEQALSELSEITPQTKNPLEILKQFETKYLGRAGLVRQFTQKISTVEPAEKPKLGQLINEVKNYLTAELTQKLEIINKTAQPKNHSILFDTTIPGDQKHLGHYHPVYKTMYQMSDIFKRLGFNIAYGPEIEMPYYNFTALNVTKDHPSQDAFDTFYLAESERKLLLRSHTSPVQVRTMERLKPPVRVIAPGKVFRSDDPDASHFPMFHQVEGLMIDKNINFAHLKGVLDIFCKEIFSKDTKTRFRPSFFPFTEPSAEVDISCVICSGLGSLNNTTCPLCRGEGWIEILGCGMVHPNVFHHVKYDPEKYTGFAFGMGVERVAMLKYGINDIRLFTENHLSFLEQF
ncbi:MAG: phenylalanine--tRNA ligase subunit alpha [Planctomycetota bacterium]